MSEIKTLDFTKLLGFETVSEQLSQAIDFQDETSATSSAPKWGERSRSTRMRA
ncbi:MAG TPA: hypothetical protein VHK26_14685 [Methyloceanibacter sp.]|nr:hypothetical protein [Methyloceanibacter sp.]